MVYRGEERRHLLRVRRSIDEVLGDKELWKSMARIIRPDRLCKEDARMTAGKFSDPEIEIYAVGMLRGGVGRSTRITTERLKLNAHGLPTEVLEGKLLDETGENGGIVTLPESDRPQLNSAGILTVRDFVLKRKEELLELGIDSRVYGEVENELFWYGIRTVENPPKKD